jgi:hypothetical protein
MANNREDKFNSGEYKIEKLTGVISIFKLAHKINKMVEGERIIIDGGELKVGDQNV